MHKTILNLHLYLALAASLFLLVICVSGCLLVFELQVDRWLDRRAYRSFPSWFGWIHRLGIEGR